MEKKRGIENVRRPGARFGRNNPYFLPRKEERGIDYKKAYFELKKEMKNIKTISKQRLKKIIKLKERIKKFEKNKTFSKVKH